jgi:hypothetical protein
MNHFRLTSPPLVEDDIENACLDLLVARGWLPFRLHCGRLKTPDGRRWITLHPKGTPDYAVIHQSLPAFLLETKRPIGGVLSPEQIQRQREISVGFRITIVVCRDAKALGRWLDEYEKQALPRKGPLSDGRHIEPTFSTTVTEPGSKSRGEGNDVDADRP